LFFLFRLTPEYDYDIYFFLEAEEFLKGAKRSAFAEGGFMAEKGRNKIGSIIYLVTGIIAIILGAVDSVAKAFLEATLPFSCGILFTFLGFKDRLDSKLSPKRIKNIHFLLLLLVIVATLAALVFRLRKL
jgi:uncharacterized membrane protein